MKRNRQKKELEEVKNEDEKSSENEEEKKVSSPHFQKDCKMKFQHYYFTITKKVLLLMK